MLAVARVAMISVRLARVSVPENMARRTLIFSNSTLIRTDVWCDSNGHASTAGQHGFAARACCPHLRWRFTLTGVSLAVHNSTSSASATACSNLRQFKLRYFSKFKRYSSRCSQGQRVSQSFHRLPSIEPKPLRLARTDQHPKEISPRWPLLGRDGNRSCLFRGSRSIYLLDNRCTNSRQRNMVSHSRRIKRSNRGV